MVSVHHTLYDWRIICLVRVLNHACYFSYMDTEQYEEAVRDYEKVYQTEKTKGVSFLATVVSIYIMLNLELFVVLNLLSVVLQNTRTS